MAEASAPTPDGVPQPSEQLHLPGPSYLPVAVAFGSTIAIVGVVFTWYLVATGLAIALFSILRWVGDTRRDMAELPLEH